MDEQLAGGNMNAVVRSGDTVKRLAGSWTPTIHRYLEWLAAAGIDWIPRVRGVDGDREILSFIEGEVPVYPLPEWVWTDAALAEAGEHLRRLHDASVGFDRAGAIWQWPAASPGEVICHNDFAPHNLVFRDGHLIGAIDFDLCAPGPRMSDIANLATRMVPLTSEKHPGAVREDQWHRRIQLLLDSYGRDLYVSDTDWLEVVRESIVRLRDEADFTRAKATELGKPALLHDADLYERDVKYLERFLAAL